MEIIHYTQDRADWTTRCGKDIDYKEGLIITQNRKRINCKTCLKLLGRKD